MPTSLVFIATANLAAVLLTLRFHKALMDGALNPAGRKRIQGLPTDGFVLINSGGPAITFLKILLTREYAQFGDPEVTRAGSLALAAQALAAVIMLAVLPSTF